MCDAETGFRPSPENQKTFLHLWTRRRNIAAYLIKRHLLLPDGIHAGQQGRPLFAVSGTLLNVNRLVGFYVDRIDARGKGVPGYLAGCR